MGGRLSLATVAASSLVEEAEAAVELSLGRPAEAAALARHICQRAATEGDPESEVVAQRALGLAARELGDLVAAKTHLDHSVLMATQGRFGQREGEGRMSLASVLAMTGRTDEALVQADQATLLLQGSDAARLQVQRALILQRLGRHDEALEGYRIALAAFDGHGQGVDQARIWINRGILFAYRGDFTAAEADLERARARYSELGLEVAAADVCHNLGFVAGLRGDVPAALLHYDLAVAEYQRLGALRPNTTLDQCQALLAVRLASEARRLALGAVRQLEAAGMEVDLAEGRLVLAQAALLNGDHAQAHADAHLARRAFVDQGRTAWAALARHVALRADWQGGELASGGWVEARATANELEASGWAAAAADARLIAARLSLAEGRVGEAEADLVRTSAARRSGPVDLRARAWHAEALLRLARGDRRGASAALRAGLRVLDQHRATLGATELRAHAAAEATDLATLGLGLALHSGRPARALAWAERWRAGSYRMPAARPSTDPEMAADLSALRLVVSEAEEAVLAGRDPSPLLLRQGVFEGSICRRARHATGSHGAGIGQALDLGQLAEALGERALVELIEAEGTLHAVTVAEGRLRLWRLGSRADAAAEVRQVRFSLGRLAHGRGSETSRETASRSLGYGARRLDDLILGPLATELGDRPLVVVPTGALHGLPWAVLPSCRGRPLSVAPSAAQWLLAQTQTQGPSPPPSRATLVAGPGIAHGETEVAELAPLHPGAVTLVGRQATVAAVSEALGGADLAHVAAHGRFRADNPLFSSLQLHDGPLTVYDLEALPGVPRHVVLSACDAGVSAVTPGDELMGLAAALLTLGAQTVVASVLPVPDAATRTLMVELHRRVMAGASQAAALAGAQAAVAGSLEASASVAVAAFTCFGAG